MTEKYGYPEAEHYDVPQDVDEVVLDELRYYPDADSMGKMLRALYKNAPIYHCIEEYAGLMESVNVTTGRSSSETFQDEEFISGGMLALHSLMKTQPKVGRQSLLFSHMIIEEENENEEIDPSGSFEQRTLQELHEVQGGGWHDTFRSLPEESQHLIVHTADTLYASDTFSAEQQESFICGYLFALGLLKTSVKINRNNAVPVIM